MTIKDQVQLIKKLHLKKGAKYLIFISIQTGMKYEDLANIPLPDHSQFVLVDGNNLDKLIKVVEVK